MLYIGCSLSVKIYYGYILSDCGGGIWCLLLFFRADFVFWGDYKLLAPPLSREVDEVLVGFLN